MKILDLMVQQHRLTTDEVELWVSVHLDSFDATAQLRGFLTGPYCVGIETVQINYPIKPMASISNPAEKVLCGKILIPDPNFWTNEMQFVYAGNIELWHDGACAEIRPIRAVFKSAVSGQPSAKS